MNGFCKSSTREKFRRGELLDSCELLRDYLDCGKGWLRTRRRCSQSLVRHTSRRCQNEITRRDVELSGIDGITGSTGSKGTCTVTWTTEPGSLSGSHVVATAAALNPTT